MEILLLFDRVIQELSNDTKFISDFFALVNNQKSQKIPKNGNEFKFYTLLLF